MKIRRLEIQGFKSFAERTVLKFGEGITGVVGPNGCGKSNIVDAIRWVMGEQSAKHLRGSGMQDVIFAGSDARGPSGMAEVTIGFKNDGSLVPPEYEKFEEISVTRRLFRDGTSEYAINRVPCRLRDILDLFMGTGVGKNAYSIIEQGRIGLIVTAKPEDRRALIEDAAGVSRYKARRKQAERRIEATEQNLLRVRDITDELGKRLSTLERQAKKAEKYKRLKEELKRLELHGAAHRFLELTSIRRYEEGRAEALRSNISTLEDTIAREEERILEILAQLTARDETLRERENQLHGHQQALALSQNNAEFLTREIEKISERKREAEEERKRLVAELERLDVERIEAEALQLALGESSGEESRSLKEREDELTLLNERIDSSHREAEAHKQNLVEALTKVAQHKNNLINIERAAADLDLQIGRVLQGKKAAAMRLREAQRKAKEVTFQLEGNRQLKLSLDERRVEQEALFERLRREHTENEALLSTTRHELMSKRSRLDSLLEIQRNYEGCTDAVRAIMKQRTDHPALERSLHGLVADFVSSEARYEAAVEAVLGDRLQSVVVSCQQDGLASIDYLKRSEKGRSSFIPLDLREDHVSWAPRPASKRPSVQPMSAITATTGDTPNISSHAGPAFAAPTDRPAPEHLVDRVAHDAFGAEGSSTVAPTQPLGAAVGNDTVLPIPEAADSTWWDWSDDNFWPPMSAPGVLGKMVDLVRTAPGYEHVARVLLGDVVVVEKIEHARKLWEENGHRKTLVTLSGEVLDPVGVLTGGSTASVSAGMLAQKREIKELTEAVMRLETQVGVAAELQASLKTRIEELDQTIKHLSKEGHKEELSIVSLEQAMKKLDAEIRRESEEKRAASEELEAMRKKRATFALERQTSQKMVEEIEASRKSIEDLVQEKTLGLEHLRSEARGMAAALTELKVTVAANTERREHAARNVTRLRERIAELQSRCARLLELIEGSAEELERLTDNMEKARAEGISLEEVVDRERKEVGEERAKLAAEEAVCREEEAAIRTDRKQLDLHKTELNDTIVRLREVQMATQSLESNISERYRIALKDTVWEYHLVDVQSRQHQDQTEKLRSQIDRIGPINLTAIDEFEEVKQRFDFLDGQKRDLEQAIASLKTAIRKINKTSKERYIEAFRLVNEKFQQVFPRLFNGGQASLVMLDESDPLESGIEMMAQPPGKKLQNVTLLSGGEKALTAVALIFAIFLIKPTPFCLLDEVDAPLDEANVGRYNDMVQDMSSISQFILITHNKKTMELPDRLYGVTMEDPGVSKIVPVDVVGRERLKAVS